MTDEFDNTNRGACWPNRNIKSASSPDYTGHLNVDGVEYWCSLWIDTAPEGKRPPITFAFHVKDEQPAEKQEQDISLQQLKDMARGPDTPQPDKPFDDDIPF